MSKTSDVQLSGRLCRVRFDPRDGALTQVLWRGEHGLWPWSPNPFRLTVTDDLRGEAYPRERATARADRHGVEVMARLAGADFHVREHWRLVPGGLAWRAMVSLKPRRRPRAVQIHLGVPYPQPCYGLGVWTARPDFPTTLERLGGLTLQYGELCYGTLLPSLTFFQANEGTGLTVTKPFGLKTARLAFAFGDYRADGMRIVTSELALRPNRPATVELLLHPHEGCWRPGLAWLYRKYRRYFDPPNGAVRKIEGGYLLGHPHMTADEIESIRPHGLKWEELHCHFPLYGDYLPDQPSWLPIDSWEACVAPEQVGGAVISGSAKPMIRRSTFDSAIPITRDLLREHLGMMRERHVRSLYYWQCAGDASPAVAQRFADAVARDRQGRPIPSFPGSTLMNADIRTSFGRHLLRAGKQLLKRFPDIDGIFLDQMCYDALDFAHDDGVTWAEGRPAYRLWHCYEKQIAGLARLLHRRHKLIFGNGPNNVEVQREVDGLMAEGASWIADAVKYLCIAKPLLFLAFYHDDARKAEQMFQRCLLCGASYSLFPHPTAEVARVIERYRPLLEPLFGRKWLLEPNPLTLPANMDGNIFTGERGQVLISLVTRGASCLDADGVTRNVIIRARFKSAPHCRRALARSVHHRRPQTVPMRRHGCELELRLKTHAAASLIVIQH